MYKSVAVNKPPRCSAKEIAARSSFLQRDYSGVHCELY